MELIKTYRETMPHVKLVGKRYTNEDRDASGTFAQHWQQWFREGWFALRKEGGSIPGVSEDCYGMMRVTDGERFEYWIGLLLSPDTQIPEGFDGVEIPAGDAGICWLRGNEHTGELYGPEASELAMNALQGQGMQFSEQGWFFERYNCPRFTVPDEAGNVILDIGAYLI